MSKDDDTARGPRPEESFLLSDARHSLETTGSQHDYRFSSHKDAEPKTSAGVWGTISLLLIGVFVSQVDASLVLATYGTVATEFGDLDSASWLMSAFILAQCTAQPLYGKLSEIYGRKASLQTAYTLFALGTLCSGLGRSMTEVILARAVQGLGGAGMVSLVSIIITDIVPVREVGVVRSYVNILQTTGRGCGGVIGGLLTEALSWRWAFLIQVPPIVMAIVIVQWRLKLSQSGTASRQSAWAKLKRVDFLGALFLCLTIASFCYILDAVGRKEASLQTPFAVATMVLGAISSIAFIISAKYAAEPIFPLRLWTMRATLTNYAIVALQTAMQAAMISTLPLFLQASQDVSTATIGASLIPAFFGNTIGGLLAGFWVKRTRKHKAMTVFGASMGPVCMILLLLIWIADSILNVARAFVIFPGGFSVGTTSSSAFVALAAGVATEDVAIASSGMYLFFSLGAILGVSSGAAVYQKTLGTMLPAALDGVEGKEAIIRRTLEDVTYVRQTPPAVRDLIVPCFVAAFHNVMYLGLLFSSLSTLSAMISPNSPLTPVVIQQEEEQEMLNEPV